MSIKQIANSLHEYANDIKVNLGNIFLPSISAGLSQKQIDGIALSCVYTTRNKKLIEAILEDVKTSLTEDEIDAAKASATIMAMNNVYYRAIHFIGDGDILKMQSGMLMQVMQKHKISKLDFELYSLAVSAINGCEYCVASHAKRISNAGVSKEGIQSTLRIASVINATAQALTIT